MLLLGVSAVSVELEILSSPTSYIYTTAEYNIFKVTYGSLCEGGKWKRIKLDVIDGAEWFGGT